MTFHSPLATVNEPLMPSLQGPLFGVGLPQACDRSGYDHVALQNVVRSAEGGGLHSVWVIDQPMGPGITLEPLTLMAHVGAITTRLSIGAAILVGPARQPVQLARMVASLDQLTGGRIIIGLGLGSRSVYESMGLRASERTAMLKEELTLITSIWERGEVEFRGDHWALSGRPPPPVIQRPRPPIYLAATSRAALERALRLADGWIGAGTTPVEDFIKLARVAGEQLRTSRQRRASFTIAKRVYVALDEISSDSREQVRLWSQANYGNQSLVERATVFGGVDDCTAALQRLVDAGADLLILNPVFQERAHLDLLIREVIPHVHRDRQSDQS